MTDEPFKMRNGKWYYRGFTIDQDWSASFIIVAEGDRRLNLGGRYETLEFACERVDRALDIREKAA